MAQPPGVQEPNSGENNQDTYMEIDTSLTFKNYFSAAIKMPTVGTEVNVAARLRWFWTILKKIDNNMIFLPHDIKDGEDPLKQIPDDEETIKNYFNNIRDNKGMFRCGFQGAYKNNEWEFKKAMYQVMGD